MVADALAVARLRARAPDGLTVTPASVETDVELGSHHVRIGGDPQPRHRAGRRSSWPSATGGGRSSPRRRARCGGSRASSRRRGRSAGDGAAGARAGGRRRRRRPGSTSPTTPTRIMDSGRGHRRRRGVRHRRLHGRGVDRRRQRLRPCDRRLGGAGPPCRRRATGPSSASSTAIIYAAGGWESSGASDAVEAYDPAADTWTRTRPPCRVPRGAGRRAVVDGQLYVIGGCDPVALHAGAAVHRYDPAADTWTAVAPYPIPISWQSCGALGGEIVCAGGIDRGRHDHHRRRTATTRAADAWSRSPTCRRTPGPPATPPANGRLLVSGASPTASRPSPTRASPTTPPPTPGRRLRRRTTSSTAAPARAASTRWAARRVASPRSSASEQLPDTPCDDGADRRAVARPVARRAARWRPGQRARHGDPRRLGARGRPARHVLGRDARAGGHAVRRARRYRSRSTVTPPASYGKLTGTLIGPGPLRRRGRAARRRHRHSSTARSSTMS